MVIASGADKLTEPIGKTRDTCHCEIAVDWHSVGLPFMEKEQWIFVHNLAVKQMIY